ncbi:RagB/SusD family nutrient uptake outer membrane protein [Pedobacter sp. MC2016-14]|uniref:RagB/SusD family nutrient uptake outer membrane protein n=1 Tax=Pedobacter sp. MC2016-14 TaxID=2897327 RepID=UPI001E63C68C|nr:RagB/SusD family nutrient uptake outer membrane protein [Pedobacter sp. MC2016-14]MCD0487115.1 RagB/SusD family nutrient uptake outer membrane protein [Pedobacter sp. MC2016-14]
MKTRYFIKAILFSALIMFGGCKKALEENPHTVFTTDYFKTAEGIQSAINSAYSGLRYDYGPIGAVLLANMGTDEFTFGDQGNSGQTLELGTYQIPPTNGSILTPWNRNYSNINLCNAILQFAPNVTMGDQARNVIMAEARYLRAHYYLLLVEQFGAVPLDLGSGDLVFTDVAFFGFNRLPTSDVLKKDYQAMITDLIFASQNLPVVRPTGAFKLSQSAALHLLSKVYLYRAYSDAKESSDFNNAYKTAMELINNKAKYGTDLLPDYSQIHKQGNDYNREVLFSIERLPLNNANNEVASPGTEFANKANIANNLFNCNYQNAATVGGVSLIDDRPLQYGRPLRQLAPTSFLVNYIFADKLNDSRYDASFRTMWRVATLRTGADLETFKAKLATVGFAIGDTAIYLAPTDARATQLKNAGKKYKILGPSEFWSNQNKTNQLYPNLKKYDDSVRNNFQDASGRPFIVAKLSEVYLIAAEAALQDGHPIDAVPLINTLRERAAFRANISATDLATRKAAMTITLAQINLDFILDERSRELCGESVRWPDLAVRKKLVERVKTLNQGTSTPHNPDGAPNVKDFHNLRPIPQDQIFSIVDPTGDPNRNKYQNPGYY